MEQDLKDINDALLLSQFRKALLADFTNFSANSVGSSVTLQLERELLSKLEDGWKYRDLQK
jgi:hypothetical protein